MQHAQFANFRIDWNVNNKHQVFLRYNYFRNEYPFNTAVGGKNALDAASDFRDRAHVLGAQVLSTFSPSVLNELRFGWPYRNEHHFADPLTGAGPQINISGIAIFNGSTGVGDRYQEKIPNLNDSVTVVRGKHTLKAGVGFQQNAGHADRRRLQPVQLRLGGAVSGGQDGNPLSYNTYSTVDRAAGRVVSLVLLELVRAGQLPGAAQPAADFRRPLRPLPGTVSRSQRAVRFFQHFRTPSKDFAPRVGLAWSISPRTVVRVDSLLNVDRRQT